MLLNSKSNDSSEIFKLKPIKNKSEFESHIIEAYKLISGFYKSNDAKKNNKNNNLLNNEKKYSIM